MTVTPTALPEVLLIEPRVLGDARGFFVEAFHGARYGEAGIPGPFVQDNVSLSARGVLRGLHLQHPDGQGKLVSVLRGEVFDVAVDVRVGSPTFGRHVGVVLAAPARAQLFIPPGFAHGFVVTGDEALLTYKCTEYFHPARELTLRWDDPDLAVRWPVGPEIVSEKDARGLSLADAVARGVLPRYEPARA